MQGGGSSLVGQLPKLLASIAVPVALGALVSLVTYMITGVSSAIPVCIALAVAVSKEARNVELERAQQNTTQTREVQRLNKALGRQQEEHLAVIRKMKLEQNQVLLKCHELEMSLRKP